MNNSTNKNTLPFIYADDPESIDFYIKRLMDCCDVLVTIRDRKQCFQNAKYNARHKELLVIYTLLDSIQELITDMKRTNTCFKSTSQEGLRATLEILPDFVISELMKNKSE